MRSDDSVLARILGAGCLLLAAWHMLVWYTGRHASSPGYRIVTQGAWKIGLYLALYGFCFIVHRSWSRVLLLVLGAFSFVFCLAQIYGRQLSGPRYSLATNLIVLLLCSMPLVAAALLWRSSNS